MSDRQKKHSKWTRDELILEALKYKKRWDFQKGSPGAYNAAYKADILDIVCAHIKPTFINWTNELISTEALKYKNIKAFQKGCQSAYNAAFRLNILDQVCAHMKRLHINWTFEMILAESLQYSNRWEFQKNSLAYYAAKDRNILDQVCAHMKRSPGHSTTEKYLFDIIKKIYIDAKKYREMKVSIDNKSHIRGFEIDIFIPELCKGIEFDGTYWHSFKGLKRRKPNWPDEDIRNYHQIKDSWFASKGIQILHIKEEDWIKDKEACIQQCLEFLGDSNEHKAA